MNTQTQELPSMPKERIQEMATALMLAKQNHDVDKLMGLYHPECIIEYPGLGIKNKGRGSIRPGLALLASLCSDFERESEGSAIENNTMVSWGIARLTLKGEFSGLRPNGKRVSLMNFVLLKFENDMIIYEGHHWDQASLCRQSGISVDAIIPMK